MVLWEESGNCSAVVSHMGWGWALCPAPCKLEDRSLEDRSNCSDTSLCLPTHQAHMPPVRKGMQPGWLRGDTVHLKRTARCCLSALCWR